ncbi:MAG TPA: cytochrome C biogenesis protein, partial [Methylotenera sp.]|nr:cytochrome C biogenesis protein [Methylotenera sp.]
MQNLIPYLVVVFIYIAVAADFWRAHKSSEKNANL